MRTGLDRLLDNPRVLEGRRYALLAHAASVTAELRPGHVALQRAGYAPHLLLAPEHGYYGVEQDMVPSAGSTDMCTGIPIVSLYGDDNRSLRPESTLFQDLDLLLIDVQDVGSRYYTYAASAIWAAEVALAAGCEVWVLDRPNPLGGVVMEGNLRQEGYESFVGAFQTPVRHGLTVGELAQLQAGRGDWAPGLRVWEMSGWSRELLWNELGRPWVAPSPNMPTFATAVLYPGGCLIEATEFSEGRGTTRPFQLLGAPHVEPLELVEKLDRLALPGIRFLPTFFRPQFHKHAAENCGGVEVLIIDVGEVRSYRMGLELLRILREMDGERFAWRVEPYEFEIDRPAIDLLTGSAEFRAILEQGGEQEAELEGWMASWSSQIAEFRQETAEVLLYPAGNSN